MPFIFKVDFNSQGQRLDNYLVKNLKTVPKSLIYRLIRKGAVKVNRKNIKQDYKLRVNDEIYVPYLEQTSQNPYRISPHHIDMLKKSIIFENRDVLIINKPAGISVHSGTNNDYGVIDILKQIYGPSQYLELAHRLDRETSGCLVLAKNRLVLNDIHNSMQANQFEKEYMALVKGTWSNSIRVIEDKLRRTHTSEGERKVIVDSVDGKEAVTRASVIKVKNNTSLVKLNPITGRTHQIRVHLSNKGFPIAGDKKYGNKEWNKQLKDDLGFVRIFLHAFSIKFSLQGYQKPISVQAELGGDLNKVLKHIGY
tara:strand:- start:1650 stop:2579 length:930 start_codon:yes stop_codon:yes gene_type:complete